MSVCGAACACQRVASFGQAPSYLLPVRPRDGSSDAFHLRARTRRRSRRRRARRASTGTTCASSTLTRSPCLRQRRNGPRVPPRCVPKLCKYQTIRWLNTHELGKQPIAGMPVVLEVKLLDLFDKASVSCHRVCYTDGRSGSCLCRRLPRLLSQRHRSRRWPANRCNQKPCLSQFVSDN